MKDQTQCNSPVPPSPTASRSCDVEAESRHSIPKARVLLDEMGVHLRFARDRIEDTAYRLPVSAGREEMLGFKRPYDVATEMWQALSEAKAELDELIDRIEAAARVTIEELAAEFPELAAAAAG